MPRAGLDPDVVVRRASALIDEHGLQALTLARVAGELGVATPSLYKHVGGLDDLIGRVAVAVTAELAARLGAASRGRSGRDALQAIADEYRRFAREHPGTYPLTQRPAGHRRLDGGGGRRRRPPSPPPCRATASGRATCTGSGSSARRCTGSSTSSAAGGFGLPTSVDESFAFLVDALDATLRTLDAA